MNLNITSSRAGQIYFLKIVNSPGKSAGYPGKRILGLEDVINLFSHRNIQYNFPGYPRLSAVLEKFTGLTRGNPSSPGVFPSPDFHR